MFMVYGIPVCLQTHLPGTRFSDTLQDFYGSCVAATEEVMPIPCGNEDDSRSESLHFFAGILLVCDSNSARCS